MTITAFIIFRNLMVRFASKLVKSFRKALEDLHVTLAQTLLSPVT